MGYGRYFEEFVSGLLLEHMRRKDGRPLGREEVSALLDEVRSWDRAKRKHGTSASL